MAIFGGSLQLNSFPAANTAAAVTLPASPSQFYSILFIIYSYSGAPVGGRLTVDDEGSTVYDVDITSGGPDSVIIPIFSNIPNTTLTVTLAAGGSLITGKLIVGYSINII